jgi:hypothetical protein
MNLTSSIPYLDFFSREGFARLSAEDLLAVS